jgi:hypothetical protein
MFSFRAFLLASLLASGSPAANVRSSPPAQQQYSDSIRRVTLHARTTLVNSNIDNLTPDEAVFFENTWREAYNDNIHGEGTQEDNDDNDDEAVRSVVIQHVQVPPPANRRQLRGTPTSRSLYYSLYSTFDIWALIEVTCSHCGDDRRSLVVESDNNNKVVVGDERNGNSHRHFESALCGKLRDGPVDTFQDVEDCRVAYLAM